MGFYQTKPVVAEAVQLCWKNWSEVCEIMGTRICADNPGMISESFSSSCGEKAPFIKLYVHNTGRNRETAFHGDWLVRDLKGVVNVLTPSEFNKKYEDIPDVTEPPGGEPISALAPLTVDSIADDIPF
jgi:hypothetical protein